MPSLSMVFDILATDRASGVFDKVGGSATRAGRDVEAASGSMSKAMTAVATGTALAGAAFAAVSVKMAADFQQSVTKLATTAGESTKNLKMVGDGMLTLAGQVGISANELAKGMYTVESSGIHGADALKVLKAAAQGAKQEQADLSKVTDAVTTALHDYNMPASDAAKVTSQMVTAVSAGKTTFDELTGSLHSVTPLAAALHVPFADIIGSLAAMTASGESADQATQNMADALRHLQAPTQPMIKELAQLGITASDLSSQLSTKGLSGTIQGVSQAIIDHLDPATKKVLLPAFNQSKIAAQDAAAMFDRLPPAARKVAQAVMDGSMSFAEYRKTGGGLEVMQKSLVDQWLTMHKSASGFSQILRSGQPAAQEYTAALQKAMGTSAGLTVALQLTGEHTAAVNASIAAIAKSAGDASGNIKGWDEVQGNFNQQLDQAKASIGAMAIQVGQHLLPALTDAFRWVNSDGIPGLKSLGSGIGDVTRWFSQLPGPVKDVALAFAALKAVEMLGWLDKLGSGLTTARLGMMYFGDSVRSSMGGASAAFAEAKAQSAFLQTLDGSSVNRFSGSLAGMGAAAKTAASGGLQALKTAGAGLVNFFGGPWAVAFVGASLVIPTVIDGIKQLTGNVIDAKAAQEGFTQALLDTNGAMDAGIRKDIQQQLLKANVADVFRKAGISARDAIDGIAGNAAAQERVNKALQQYILDNPGTVHNKDATAAMNARNAYEQLAVAFGGGVTAAKYFAGATETTTGKVKGETATVQSLTAAIHAIPNGHTTITADTKPAVDAINNMLSTYRSQVINLRAQLPQVAGVQRMGTYADGGYTGQGAKYTPAGIVHANEFVFPSEAVNRLGVGFLGQLAGLPGYAGGGLVRGMDVGSIGTRVTMDTSGVGAQFAATIKSLQAAAAALAVGSGVERWRGTVDAVLRAMGRSTGLDNGILSMISHESGGNPNAINLTDSNARAGHPSQGLMQTIPSTFYAYAGPYASRGITDPFANIYAGVSYALRNYGAGMLAAGGRHALNGAYVGYKTGTNFVPTDGPAYLHRGEAVIPANKNPAPYQSRGPLVGEVHVHNQVDLDLLLQQAQFRERSGSFS